MNRQERSDHTLQERRPRERPSSTNCARAHCGTLLACLRMALIARRERRGREAEELPERIVPWHDREHDTDRIKHDGAFRWRSKRPTVSARKRWSSRRSIRFCLSRISRSRLPTPHGLPHFARNQLGELCALPCAQYWAKPCKRSTRSHDRGTWRHRLLCLLRRPINASSTSRVEVRR